MVLAIEFPGRENMSLEHLELLFKAEPDKEVICPLSLSFDRYSSVETMGYVKY